MVQPKIWVRVVETHATRTWVAIILAISAGASMILLVGAAMWNVISNPDVQDLSPNYSSAISATLGVSGGCPGYLCGTVGQLTAWQYGCPLHDDDITLDLEPPKEG